MYIYIDIYIYSERSIDTKKTSDIPKTYLLVMVQCWSPHDHQDAQSQDLISIEHGDCKYIYMQVNAIHRVQIDSKQYIYIDETGKL